MNPYLWRKVVKVERQTAWWDLLSKTPLWFLELECGHACYRRALKAPKKVRCQGCVA